jgi:predicted ATPase
LLTGQKFDSITTDVQQPFSSDYMKLQGSDVEAPRVTYLRVRNYRALQDVQFKDLTAFTVFLGPNGSGKTTALDVFAFLSECFTLGLRKAWDKRGRFRELRTRDGSGPIEFDIKYREKPNNPLITYHLAIDEDKGGPFVAEEWLRWRRLNYGQPFHFLFFKNGSGEVVTGEMPDESDKRVAEDLDSREMLAVNTLGQLAKNPRVSALRRFITGWYLSYLTAESTRGTPEAGPQERLSITGDNLPNVVQYLSEQHPKILSDIIGSLQRRVPKLEKVYANMMQDGRLLLQIKDAPFERPILSKFASDGTLKMLAYLTVLYDPNPPQLIGIEEPENHLHPRLLPEIAEECRKASYKSQILATTHSPYFIDGVHADELWVFYRDPSGYTKVKKASEMERIPEFVKHGAKLGSLWAEGQFEFGDPLTNSGGPTQIEIGFDR